MEYIFDGKSFSVELDPQASTGEVNARINGEPFNLKVIKISENCLLLISGDIVRRAYVAAYGAKVLVHFDGKTTEFNKITEDRKSFSKEALEFGSKDHVSTPMPGKIVKILVKEGEKVTLKQPLVIVESMKMENELKSPSNGTIKSIHFASGDLVGTGQPIIRIEPTE